MTAPKDQEFQNQCVQPLHCANQATEPWFSDIEVRNKGVESLCGADINEGINEIRWQFPYSFMNHIAPEHRCLDCEAHPDLPLLVLNDMDYLYE